MKGEARLEFQATLSHITIQLEGPTKNGVVAAPNHLETT